MSSPTIFHINGHPIPRTFYGLVVRACNGDKHRAALVFFRASQVKDLKDPITWISHGLKNGYAFKPCMAEENGGGPARAWIEANIEKATPRTRSMMSIGDVLAGMKIEVVEDKPKPRRARAAKLKQMELFQKRAR